jgi:hypothetical protein
MCVFLMAGLVGLSTSDRILTSYAPDSLYQRQRARARQKPGRVCAMRPSAGDCVLLGPLPQIMP